MEIKIHVFAVNLVVSTTNHEKPLSIYTVVFMEHPSGLNLNALCCVPQSAGWSERSGFNYRTSMLFSASTLHQILPQQPTSSLVNNVHLTRGVKSLDSVGSTLTSSWKSRFSLVSLMISMRMQKSPNRSPSSRSSAYRFRRGFMMARISSSLMLAL